MQRNFRVKYQKVKKVPLNSLTLHQHPLLTSLLVNEKRKLPAPPDYTTLSYGDIQILLDTTPVPVFQDENGDSLLLMPMPFLHHLRLHPLFNKFEVTLVNFKDPKQVSHIISILNVLKPSVLYIDFKQLPNLLCHRINAAKQADIPILSKKQLAHFAQLSPSTIRI